VAPQCSGPSCAHHEMRGSSARSSSRGSSSSFGNALDRRTPDSKKYAHVASSLDTGASAKKQVVVSANVAAKRRDEIFKRIRPATLVRMLEERNVNESIFHMGGYGSDRPDTSKSVCSVVASKAGPLSIAGAASVASVHTVAGSVLSIVDSSATVDDTRDLVLLDLRERADFDQCRLPLAINYPASLINRDQFTPELHRCKRDVSKLLVVYHVDDQSTAGVAMLLAQKGWDTVHAVTGGFEELAQSYPEVLEGELPARPDTTSTIRSAPRSSGAGRSAGTPLRGGRPPRL